MRLFKGLRKIISVIATTAVIFNSLAPSLLVLAQEVTPEPTPTPVEESTPAPTPEETLIPTESPSASPESTPEVASPTPEVIVDPSPATEETTPAPESQPEFQDQTNENVQSQGPPSESPTVTPSAEPTVTPIQPEEEGSLTAEVLETSLFSETLQENSWFQVITDKLDYAPTEAAVITGTGFTSGETYSLTISSSDEPATSTTVEVTADLNGSFTYIYQLDGIYRPNYLVEVKANEELLTTITFTDSFSPSIDLYDQCSNDDGDGFTTGDTGCRWIFGNLQHSNSTYFEDDSTVQRLAIDGLITGDYTVTVKYGTTKGGKHAYDFITDDKYSETWITNADICDSPLSNIPNCSSLTPSNSGLIPTDSNAGGHDVAVPNRHFQIRNGTWSNVGTIVPGIVSGPTLVSGSYAGDSETTIQLKFHVDTNTCDKYNAGNNQNPVYACEVLITFGAHVSSQEDWGPGTSAISIPGSPYHVSLEELDGGSAGARDNQMQADAIIPASSITFIKDASPDSPQDFAFTTSGNGISNFSLDDDSDLTLLNSVTFNDLLEGTYTATETTVPGWLLGSPIVCQSDGADDYTQITGGVSIDLNTGENVTCTFVNTQVTGSITIIKESDPDDSQDFSFTGDLGPFSLDDDADNTLQNSQTFSSLVGGTYLVTEGELSGWDLTGLVCNDTDGGTTVDLENRTATIDLDHGQNLTCTFTNTKLGTIIVEKQTNPEGASGNFTFTGTAAGTISDNGQIIVNNLTPGQYSSVETDPTPGFDLTGIVCNDTTNGGTASAGDLNSRTATFNLDAGETVKCIFTNTQRGSISGIKYGDADGDNTTTDDRTPLEGWIIELWKWVTSAFVDTGITDTTDADGEYSFENLLPGLYQVREQWPVLGWTNVTSTSSDNVELDPGEDVENINFANFENVTVTGCKVADPDGIFETETGRTNVAGWAIDLIKNGQTIDDTQITGENGCYTWTDLGPGDYGVAEETQAGWINLNPTTYNFGVVQSGEDYTHTFVNTELGSITITKQTNPDESLEEFTFNLTGGATDSSLLSDGESDTYIDLLPGSYTITETIPTGWSTEVSVLCDDASYGHPTTLDLASGQHISCTFTNTQLGQIIIEKQTDPDGSTQSFHFNASYDGDGFDLADDEQDVSAYLTPNVYSVSEVVPAGWNHTNTPCSDQSYPDGISLQAGETVTCVFDNTELGNITVIKYNDHDGDGTKDVGDETLGDTGVGTEIEATRWEINLLGTGVDSSQWTGAQVQGQVTFSDLLPNSFTLSEQLKSGWVQTNITCGQEGEVYDAEFDNLSFSLAAGQDLTCYIGNQGQGTIIVEKEVEPDSDATFDFSIEGDFIEKIGFVLGDGDSTDPDYSKLPAGIYNVTETTDEFYSTLVSCVSNQGDTETASEVDLDAGETVTCTFTNTRNRGTIIVHKLIDLDGNPDTDDRIDGEDWEMTVGGDSEDTSNPEPQFTDANGETTFDDLKTGDYNVFENLEDGFDLLDAYCDEGNGSFDGGIYEVEVGEGDIVNCTFINSPNGTIHGRKWNDADGDGEMGEETLLGGWKIFIDENENGTWEDGEPYEITDDDEDLGWYSFDHLMPDIYSICEVPQDGWEQTSSPTCHTVELPEGPETLNTCQYPEVQNSTFGRTCDFGNQELPPGILIEKSNDKSGGASAGDTVTYTLVVTNTGKATLSSIDVTDVLPGGFTYVINSTSVNGVPFSDIGLTKTGSTLKWSNVGILDGGEHLTLSYKVIIASDMSNGTYVNFATCTGYTRSEQSIDCNTDDSTVSIGSGTSYGGNLRGQVLGASTELPATGSPTVLLMGSLALLGAGLILNGLTKKNKAVVVSRKTRKHAKK